MTVSAVLHFQCVAAPFTRTNISDNALVEDIKASFGYDGPALRNLGSATFASYKTETLGSPVEGSVSSPDGGAIFFPVPYLLGPQQG